MDFLDLLEPLWRFGAALLIGALVGLEREYVWQRSGDPEFAGIRTFSLMAVLGAMAAFFAERHGIFLFVVPYLGLVLLVWASHLGNIYHEAEEGITTEVVALIVPLLGAMVIWGFAELAAGLAVIVALVLALKPTLHGLARRMSAVDLRATLEFALISAVVLPLLPNQDLGPYGVLNPRDIWLLVVLVSGISFLGYILIKVLGAERGIGITGVLGGLVSSTAVTLSFSGRSRNAPELSSIFAMAIVLASGVMFPRVLIEVAVVNAALLSQVALPIGAMLAAGVVAAIWLWRRRRRADAQVQKGVELANPLRITTAMTFGLAFAIALMAIKAANEIFGDVGVYVASALAGLADVDAITLSASDLAAKGQVEPRVAAISIVLASLVNTTVKAVTASVLGTRELRRLVVVAYGAILVTGLVVGGIALLLTP